jgi:hypothetical protein
LDEHEGQTARQRSDRQQRGGKGDPSDEDAVGLPPRRRLDRFESLHGFRRLLRLGRIVDLTGHGLPRLAFRRARRARSAPTNALRRFCHYWVH